MHLEIVGNLTKLYPNDVWLKILWEALEDNAQGFEECFVRIDRLVNFWGKKVSETRRSWSFTQTFSIRDQNNDIKIVSPHPEGMHKPTKLEINDDPDFPKISKYKNRKEVYDYATGVKHCTHLVKQYLREKPVPELIPCLINMNELYWALEGFYVCNKT